jgi:hypothetical protein
MIYTAVHSYRVYESLIKICLSNKECFDINSIHLTKHNQYSLNDYLQFFSNPSYIRVNEGICYDVEHGFSTLFNYYNEVVSQIGVCYEDGADRYKGKNLFLLPEEKQILKEWLPDFIRYVDGNYWVNDTTIDLKLIDADAGEIKWIYTLPEIVRPRSYNQITNTKKVLGTYKNNLWIQLPDSRVLALDIETGKVNYEINHFYFSAISDGIFLDNKGVIIIFHYNVYAEFSLDSMTFNIEKILGNENELIIRQVTHHNGDANLYFTGNKDNSFEPNVYGFFNTETQTIQILKQKEPEMVFFYQAPQVNKELFVILDEKGNLLIHKRDEM